MYRCRFFRFLSEEGLIESIGLEKDAPYSGLCMAYFNGDYPTPLYDYEEKYQESLKESIVLLKADRRGAYEANGKCIRKSWRRCRSWI